MLDVQYPMDIRKLSGFAFLTLYAVYGLLREMERGGSWGYYAGAALLFGGALAALSIRRWRGRPRLQLGAETMTVHGIELHPGRIEVIRMERDRIGIVPYGRKIPPLKYCLQVPEREDRLALIRWATGRCIEVREGKFMSWV
ncbi:hypothetical protein [Cohnella sp. REN36]|uniref:hypothetical protein n=1 Tax=Cohnella sp. REN36 TaxID=2887347 RepID=UPI001D13ED3E|nr:hypothetical protein [Cohnella sp. REN36]MCC3376031.1 hypothetical protein [Cohnella sp. REN36]